MNISKYQLLYSYMKQLIGMTYVGQAPDSSSSRLQSLASKYIECIVILIQLQDNKEFLKETQQE